MKDVISKLHESMALMQNLAIECFFNENPTEGDALVAASEKVHLVIRALLASNREYTTLEEDKS